MIERFYAIVDKEVTDYFLPINFRELESQYSLKLKNVENNHIRKVFEMCNRNGQEASRVLGISYNTLKSRIEIIYNNKNEGHVF